MGQFFVKHATREAALLAFAERTLELLAIYTRRQEEKLAKDEPFPLGMMDYVALAAWRHGVQPREGA